MPASLSFGSVLVGNNSTQNATLTAQGTAVVVSSAAVSPEFSISGLSLPVTIAAGQSVGFQEIFSPQASGQASGSLTFVSDAANSPFSESVSGTGSVASQHYVDLSWMPSTSQVIGYNVYRGSVSGGPYAKVNSVLDAATDYTDVSVQAGQTYYYVTTAVDSSGYESSYSNEFQATIPTP
jgi:hypothetical protein